LEAGVQGKVEENQMPDETSISQEEACLPTDRLVCLTGSDAIQTTKLPGAATSPNADSGVPFRSSFRTLKRLASLGTRFLHEIKEIGKAAWRCSVDLFRCGKAVWQRRSLQRAVVAAQLALGERMYAAGIDDGELGKQLTTLDEKIRQATVASIPIRTLTAQRQKLILQLAAAALAEEAPLPGADAEYARAREALAALARHDTRMSAAQVKVQEDKVGLCLANGEEALQPKGIAEV